MSIDIHFVFLKTSRDTLDLKFNIKWNLWNIHIARLQKNLALIYLRDVRGATIVT